MDCFEGKFKVNMRLVTEKQNVKCAWVVFVLALDEYLRNSGDVSSDEMYIHRAHTEPTLKTQREALFDDTLQGYIAPN